MNHFIFSICTMALFFAFSRPITSAGQDARDDLTLWYVSPQNISLHSSVVHFLGCIEATYNEATGSKVEVAAYDMSGMLGIEVPDDNYNINFVGRIARRCAKRHAFVNIFCHFWKISIYDTDAVRLGTLKELGIEYNVTFATSSVPSEPEIQTQLASISHSNRNCYKHEPMFTHFNS